MLTPHLAPEAVAPAIDRFRELYADHSILPVPACPARTRPSPPYAATRGRSLLVTGKFGPNAQRHVDHLALDIDQVERRGLGRRQGRRAARRGRLGLRRRPRPRRRGRAGRRRRERLGAHRRLHPRRAGRGGHPRRARLPRRVPRRGSTSTSSTCGWPPWRRGCASSAPCWSPSAAVPTVRSLLAAAVRDARAPTGSSRRPATPTRSRPSSATRAATSRRRWGCELLTPRTHEMEREGYRANSGERCYFCKAELIETLGPLAERARHRPRRHRHQRRRRGGRVPSRASGPPPSAAP